MRHLDKETLTIFRNGYTHDVLSLREEFKSTVNPDDIISIQKWFSKYYYLNTADHASVSGRTIYWIRQLKKKAHIKGTMPANLPKQETFQAPINIEVPDDWETDKEWLQKMAKKHSLSTIARSVGKPISTMHYFMKRIGVEMLGEKAKACKNPYFTHEWCYHHYSVLGLSQRECAERAGISQQQFGNWLANLNIPIRRHPIVRKHIRLWIQKLVNDLERLDIVRKIFHRADFIHVRYKGFVGESYYTDLRKPSWLNVYHVTERKAKIDSIPTLENTYEPTIDNNYDAHIGINEKHWKAASFMEKRIALHQFCQVFSRRGWIWPTMPEHEIDTEWNILKTAPREKYRLGTTINFYPYINRPTIGTKIIMHFFGLEELYTHIFSSPNRTLRTLNTLFKDNTPINTYNAIRATTHTKYRFPKKQILKVVDPGAYKYIFDILGYDHNSKILDLSPGHGHKAMACALAGITYVTLPNERFEVAMERGFGEFIGLKHEYYDGQKVDLIINDRNLKGTDKVDHLDALEYSKSSNKILHFVKRKHRAEEQSQLQPSKILNLHVSPPHTKPDHFFLL